MFLANKLNKGAAPAAATTDPQFNYVTMLLHGNGTNGAQNNTFLDSSTNNFTITRNGNTTQGSFSPYGSNWSNYFNGSSTLSLADNAVFTLPADFTIEFWFFQTGAFQDRLIIDKWSEYYVYTRANGVIGLAWGPYNASGMFGVGGIVQSGSNGFTLNAWTHVAAVRNSNTFTLYINGVSVSTATNSATVTDTSAGITIGDYGGGGGYAFEGYISNARIVKGTAVYTANFTPSTTPLTAITNTSLLTCQSNRFIDNSANNFTITPTATSVQRFNPFGTATAYSTSVIGGSGYFDGTGDYLQATAAAVPAIGTSDYTISGWWYLNEIKNYQILLDFRNGTNPEAVPYLYVDSTGSADYYVNGTSHIFNIPFKIYQWYYIVISRVSGTTKVFVNGTQVVSYSDSVTYVAGRLTLGVNNGGGTGYYYNGYISDFKVVIGTGTTSGTPTTAPATATSGTQALLSMTNGAIFDNAMMNHLETVGNAQISTSVVKYGTGSLNINGTATYLSGNSMLRGVVPNPNFEIGRGDFTVEGWFYQTNVGSTYQSIMEINNHLGIGGILFIGSYLGNACVYAAGTGGGGFVAQQATTTNTWQHIAYVRSNGTLRTYVNGTSTSSQAGFTLNINCTYGLTIGSDKTGNAAYYYYGYMDELRVSRYARYTSNFTPPTAAFLDIGPT